MGEPLLGSPVPPEFASLSAELRGAWVGFAVTGDPGWPEYRPGEALMRRWDAPATAVADPVATSRQIWRERASAH
ncbi:hypothetical protein ABZ840_22820 [Streptomyces sp. NPDC047117]|uniref:hypothetical protein n=1 Tax=Streptomyces sp. NPDC047117 TaxID=3155379 RepID=UPI0033D0E83D